jgi:hypothetical protein
VCAREGGRLEPLSLLGEYRPAMALLSHEDGGRVTMAPGRVRRAKRRDGGIRPVRDRKQRAQPSHDARDDEHRRRGKARRPRRAYAGAPAITPRETARAGAVRIAAWGVTRGGFHRINKPLAVLSRVKSTDGVTGGLLDGRAPRTYNWTTGEYRARGRVLVARRKCVAGHRRGKPLASATRGESLRSPRPRVSLLWKANDHRRGKLRAAGRISQVGDRGAHTICARFLFPAYFSAGG